MTEWQANEATLVQLASEGDHEAFATLYEHHFDSVYDFLTRLDNPAYTSVHRVMQDIRQPAARAKVEAIGVSYYDASVPKS